MSAGAGKSVQETELRLTATNQTDRAFRQAAENMKNMGNAFERSAASQAVLFQRTAGGLAGLERRLTAATAAMSFGEVLRSSVSEFAATDRRLTRLGQNADQSKDTIVKFKSELIKLANESGQSIDTVIKGFETMVQQTGDYKLATDQIGLVVRANKALDAQMEDTAQTARVLADNLKIKPGAEMEKAFDIFVRATQKGKFEAKDFAANMPVLATAMEQAGLRGHKGLAEMAAIMELISRKAPDNERAVLAFRDAIQKMGAESTSEHFKNNGLLPLDQVLDDVKRKGGDVLAATADHVDKSLSILAKRRNIPEADKMSLLPRLFPEQDSQRGITALLEYKYEVKGMRDEILQANGEMKKRYAEVNDDISSRIDVIKNKFWELRQSLGRSMVKFGIFEGMDEFSHQIDDIAARIGSVGDAIERIREQNKKNGVLGGAAQAVKEIGAGAIGTMHAELERVSKMQLDRARRNAEKSRFKENAARAAGDEAGAAGHASAAESEEGRVRRLEEQLKHGFTLNRLTMGDGKGSGSPSDVVDTMRLEATDEMRKRALESLPAERSGTMRMGQPLPSAEPRASAPTDPMMAEVERLRGEVDAIKRARDEVGAVRRRMRPEFGGGAVPAINQAPNHTPGGLVDPYAPPAGFQPSAYEGNDIAAMIRNASLLDETSSTTDTAASTARLQQDQMRLTETTNAILLRLIANARYGAGSGDGIGAGGAGSGGGSGGGGGGSGGGGGTDARHPFGGGGGGGGQARGGGGSGGSSPAPDGGAASVPGALNPRLAGSRKAMMDELDSDPGLRRDVIKTASMENRGSSFKMQAVLESMVNRAKMNGYKSLRQAIHSGFYGPVNRGGLSGGLSEKDRADGEAALAQVRGGSNAIGYRTDQGMLTDPGARRYMQEADHSGHQKIGGENFFYMGQKGRAWAKQQEALDAAGGGGTPRNPFGESTAGSAEGLRVKSGEATAGGRTEGGVFDLARSAQSDLPGGVKHFASFNDAYHAGTGSKHASGLAFDTSLNDPSKSGDAAEAMRAKLRAGGLSDADFKVIDEYKNKSGRWTGGHIHTQFNTREAARRYGEYASKLREGAKAQDKSEKAQVAAIPRSPFTPGSAGANPPTNPQRDMTQAERAKDAAKNPWGGSTKSLTELAGPAPKKNGFGGTTTNLNELNEFVGQNDATANEFVPNKGDKRTVPLPPRRPNIDQSRAVPRPPSRPDEFKPKPQEPPSIYRETTGKSSIYGSIKNAPEPPRRPSADALDAETAAIRKHREEAEKPIRLRYQSDGLGRSNTHADTVHLRRATDASLRSARQNSYSDTGVA